ncbi:MAG: transcription-repair coupling factor, partial [Oscillospiraceae bacterium]
MKNSVKAVVASVESVCQYTVPPSRLKKSVLNLKPLQTHKIEDITKFLSDMGYQRREQVDGICQFALRGGILDFFPPHLVDPVRIEFWGDEIDTMATFKIETQRRVDNIEEVVLTPAREVLAPVDEIIKLLQEQLTTLKGKSSVAAKEHIAKEIDMLESGVQMLSYDRFLPLIYPEFATVLDYFSGSIVAMSDQAAIKENYRALSTQHFADVKIMLEEGLLWNGCNQFYDDLTAVLQKACKQKLILLDSFARTAFDIPIRSLIEFRAIQLAAWSGEYSVLHEEIADYVAQKYCCVVFAGTERTAQALTGDLQKDGISVDFVADVPKLIGGKVFVVEGSITAGFDFPDINLMVLSHGTAVLKAKAKTAKKSGLKNISDLTVGDYVVHISHGIGVFEGIVKREIHGVTKDYIKIRYAGTDMLFVPVTQLDLVSKYIGGREEVTVKLSKLNSAEWGKTRQRVRKAVAEMADELVKLYAARMESKGYQFGEDTDWQNDFERRFPYRETDDQLRCIDEMKKDMQSTVPMDRLLCGDVGFGKTEVAIRGAFKCVLEGKQCAVLVPTTILAWQHYQTFRKRMEGFPVKIELLSRFRTPKQQEQILKELKRGEIDIIIGTHRLVQKDVIFKDLGLCIIDEEQRFGVAHKERFKELRNNVDVLTLSATPIPRTLNMAMSGIRDMSVIEEAPQDRIPVQTYVMEHDWGVIRQAITKELRRGGQVFYLHNRVDTIDRCALTLQELVPDARIVVAHGKMGEEALSRVWKQLVDNEIDILVCTTIIETGVDVSNCNTLIIEDADRLGLSQLYQIRGRVGRSSRRAYAYMTVTP